MAERERKQKPAPKEREEVVDEEVAASSERGEKLKEDIDDLLGRNRLGAGRQRRGIRPRHTCRRAVSSYVQKA